MATNVHTMNLSDNGDGMVPLSDNPTTAFITNDPNHKPPQRALPQVEKNVSENKQTMDSTPINDIMMEPPMMMEEPRMQGMMPQMTAPQPQGAYAMPQQEQKAPESKNPLNLTDDQLVALIAGAAAALAVSKPVQDKLVTSVPKFLNEQGTRSMVGLASTGLVAAVVFYFAKAQLVKA
jgi:hypothetical protein